MISLRSLTVTGEQGAYPFVSPQVVSLGERQFTASVTLLAGENGTGKSTLLEALARKLALPAIGGEDASRDNTLKGLDPLCGAMKLTFGIRVRKGFFLRAEDFFNFTKRITALQQEMAEELIRAEKENAGRSEFAKAQSRMAYASSLQAMNSSYGQDPDARSHGESFLALFKERIVPGGIYLLDEPEAPLSPMRQLALAALIMDREKDSQFIIATHSPVLMAYPGADIWCFDDVPVSSRAYEDLEHISFLRDFMKRPGQYMESLRRETDTRE
jgi:predicted ATPase